MLREYERSVQTRGVPSVSRASRVFSRHYQSAICTRPFLDFFCNIRYRYYTLNILSKDRCLNSPNNDQQYGRIRRCESNRFPIRFYRHIIHGMSQRISRNANSTCFFKSLGEVRHFGQIYVIQTKLIGYIIRIRSGQLTCFRHNISSMK